MVACIKQADEGSPSIRRECDQIGRRPVSVTRSSLALADKNSLSSIAFPAISTGVFSYPIGKCARFMIRTTIGYLKDNPRNSLELVVFCLYGQAAFDVFAKQLKDELGGALATTVQ